ncbi:hypothetical protein M8494_11455 [Serratia ureilytica]
MQLFSTVFISNILRDAKVNLGDGRRLASPAGDDGSPGCRYDGQRHPEPCGIYYLQDKATGSTAAGTACWMSRRRCRLQSRPAALERGCAGKRRAPRTAIACSMTA